MTDLPPNKESIQSRLNRIRQSKSYSDNLNTLSEQQEDTKNISSKETTEMRNEFQSVLQNGNMTKDKFSYFIQQANDMFQNYEKQLMYYKKKTSYYDYKDLSINSNDKSFCIIPNKKEVVLRQLKKMTENEKKTLNDIKIAYTDKICELLQENETYKNMIDKLTFDVVNRLQEKINELGEMLKKEIKEKESLDSKLKSMDSVFKQNSKMKEEIDMKDEEIDSLLKLRDEHGAKIKSLNEEIATLKKDIENYLSTIEEKDKLLDDREILIKTMKSQIDDKNKIIEDNSKQLKEKESEIELLYTDNLQWEDKYKLVSKEIENFKKWSLWDQNLIESYKKIESLDLENKEKAETITKLQEEAVHIKTRNEELSNELTLLKGEASALRSDNDSLKLISAQYDLLKEKTKDYTQLQEENIKYKSDLLMMKDNYENQLTNNKEKYDTEMESQKKHYETEIETQKQQYELMIAKKENEYESKVKGSLEKEEVIEKRVNALQKCIDELNSQLDKKNEALTNYKDLYNNLHDKLKAMENEKSRLEQGISSSNSIDSSIPEVKEEKSTKAYSTFDKFAFTKEIMIDYLYCLSVCESGLTMPHLISNISKNLDIYMSTTFSASSNISSQCLQCEIIKDICFTAYDKLIEMKLKKSKRYDDPTFFMINFEDFSIETIKQLAEEIMNNNFITRIKNINKLEQIFALFVKKYSKTFDFDVDLDQYVKDNVIPAVTSRFNRISRMQGDEFKTLIELILHNIKDGSIYIGNKEVYSFENYFNEYLKYKSLDKRNERLIIEKPITNKEEIDNIIHIFKFEKPLEVFMTTAFNTVQNTQIEPDYAAKTIFNSILLYIPRIQVLSLPMNNLCGALFTNDFLETLKLLKEVTYLNLASNSISDEDLKPFTEYLKGNKTIKTLILDHNLITTTGGFFFADALVKNKTLLTLSLSKNEVNESGFSSMINILTNSNNTLQELYIAENNLHHDDYSAIADYFNANPALMTLDLSGNKIDNTSANVMGVTLKKAKQLQTFKLNSTNLNEESGPQLLNFIPDTNIKTLELNHNNIGKALFMLINKIRVTQSLKCLGLKQCGIMSSFLDIMAANIKNTVNLDEIHLEGNSFDEVNFKKFIKEMEDNTKIVIYFSKGMIPKKATDIIGNNKNIIIV